MSPTESKAWVDARAEEIDAPRKERELRRQQDAAEAEQFRAMDANWSAVNLATALVYIRRLIRANARLEQRLREAGL